MQKYPDNIAEIAAKVLYQQAVKLLRNLAEALQTPDLDKAREKARSVIEGVRQSFGSEAGNVMQGLAKQHPAFTNQPTAAPDGKATLPNGLTPDEIAQTASELALVLAPGLQLTPKPQPTSTPVLTPGAA